MPRCVNFSFSGDRIPDKFSTPSFETSNVAERGDTDDGCAYAACCSDSLCLIRCSVRTTIVPKGFQNSAVGQNQMRCSCDKLLTGCSPLLDLHFMCCFRRL